MVSILPLSVENPTDYTQVLTALHIAAGTIMAGLAGTAEIRLHVSAASGTPTIKTGMILLVSSGVFAQANAAPPQVYQVANPLYVTDDRVSTVDVTIIEAARLGEHGCALLERESLDAARQDLRRLAEIAYAPGRRDLAAKLDTYCDALQQHERLSYGDARQALSDLLGDAERQQRLMPLVPLIRRQVQTLQRLVSGDQLEVLNDLLLNAERRQRRGEYADALARCWRVIEETLRERLNAHHGIDPEGGTLSPTQRVALATKSDISERLLDTSGQNLKRNLYVVQLVQILETLGDAEMSRLLDTTLAEPLQRKLNARLRAQALGESRLATDLSSAFGLRNRRDFDALLQPRGYRIVTYRDLLKWINRVRNHSVVAHGYCDVGLEDGEAGCALARRVMASLIREPDPNHPFGLSAYQHMVRDFAAMLTRV